MKRCLRVSRRYVEASTGQTFWTDPASVFGFELMRAGICEPQMTRLLQLVLRPGEVFVDIGGHEGYFSIIAASLLSGGAVHWVEPQRRLLPVIRENIRVNAADSIVLHPLAISDKEGEVELFLRPTINSAGSSMFRYWRLGSRKERVPATTLDALFEANTLTHVRLMKVDCEGAEQQVIAGGRDVLRRNMVQFIAMEYHPQICGIEGCEFVDGELRSAGYVLTRVRLQCIYHLPGLEKELEMLGPLEVGGEWFSQ